MAMTLEQRRERAPKMPPVASAIRECAWLCLAKAQAAEEAFLKHADPRAVQGGAVDLEANEWRLLRSALNKLALDAQDLEGG